MLSSSFLTLPPQLTLYFPNDIKSDIPYYFSSVGEKLGNHCKDFEVDSCIKQTVPIVDWLFNYEWKKDIVGDVIAGVTVAVMHIPQGTFFYNLYCLLHDFFITVLQLNLQIYS